MRDATASRPAVTPWLLLLVVGSLVACGDAGAPPVGTETPATLPRPTATDVGRTSQETGSSSPPVSPTTPVPTMSTVPPASTTSTMSTMSPTAPVTTTARSAPTAFTERERYPDCGEDASLSLDANGPPSRQRQCFLAANLAGKPAELTARELGTTSGGLADLIYRTAPDGTIEVYATGNPWQLTRCAGLRADDRRVFTVIGCDEPITLD